MADPPTSVALPDETPVPVANATTRVPESTPAGMAPAAGGETAAPAEGVFLKQDGKVYLVKDWATLQRWIMERRVGREDLVSEGGVRWEPIGSRPELGSFFAAVEQLEAAEIAGMSNRDTPFPVEDSRPWEPGASAATPVTSGFARLDDETEGVPLGLPPLPTEDLEPTIAEEDYPDAPPSRLEAASPAEPELAAEPEVADGPIPLNEAPSPAPPDAYVDPNPSISVFSEQEGADGIMAFDEAALGFDEAPMAQEDPLSTFDEPSISDAPDPRGPDSMAPEEPMESVTEPKSVEPEIDAGLASSDATIDEDEPIATEPSDDEMMFAFDEPVADAPEEAPSDSPAEASPDSGSEDPDSFAEEDDSPLLDPFAEPSVALEQDPTLGASESEGTRIDEFAATEQPAEPRAEEPSNDDTDEFDLDDPFRDFTDAATVQPTDDAAPDDEIVKAAGPPGWMWWAAAAVVTAAVILFLFYAYNQGMFGQNAADPTPEATAATAPVPAPVETPPVAPETPASSDATDVSDGTDSTDSTDETDSTDSTDETDAGEPITSTEPPAEPAETAVVTPPVTTPTVTKPPPTTRRSTPKPVASTAKGWDALGSGNSAEAVRLFRDAVAAKPGSAQAQLGLGRALQMSGRASDAKGPLCRARSLGNTDIQREANAFLKQGDLTCP